MILAVVDNRVIRVEVIGSHGHGVAKFLASLDAIGDAGVKDLWCNLWRTYITAKNCRDCVRRRRLVDPRDDGSYLDLHMQILKAGWRARRSRGRVNDVDRNRAFAGHIYRGAKLPGALLRYRRLVSRRQDQILYQRKAIFGTVARVAVFRQ